MKKIILLVLALLLLSTTFAFAETVKFSWVYSNPPTDLKEFQIFQETPAGEWDLLVVVPLDERTTTVEGALNPVSNVFGIWAVDNDDLHSNMKVANLLVNPCDIDSFSITIQINVTSP